MYVCGGVGDAVYEYDLSTAWNISTASYVQMTGAAVIVLNPSGLFFKSDGLKMYLTSLSSNSVYEYNLSTAWDISTVSLFQTYSISAQTTFPEDIFFKPDGLKFYIVTPTNDAVYEYDLSTAWNISTASYLQNFSVAAQDTFPTGLFFSPDGLGMYVLGLTNDSVYQYTIL
jgi:hypothetical protein